MLNLKKVAVTGGLASGKSTVCKLLHELCIKQGIHSVLVSADQIVQKHLDPNDPLGKKLIQLCVSQGVDEKTINKKESFDKKALANVLFSNKTLLKSWEEMIHPIVFQEIKKVFEEGMKTKAKKGLLIAEIPLLFEKESHPPYFDVTVAVIARRDLAEKRFQEKGGALDDFNLRVKNQMAEEEKSNLATYTIENDGTKENLKQKVEDLFHLLTEES